MDKGFRIMARRVLLAVILGIMLTGFAPPASSDGAQIEWGGHTLEIISIQANPAHIHNEASEASDYYMIGLKSTAAPIPIHDVGEVLDQFSLRDAEAGESYPAGAYMPYDIAFSDRVRVFTTWHEQSQFSLFFVVPQGTPLESLSLVAGGESLPLADMDLAALVQ